MMHYLTHVRITIIEKTRNNKHGEWKSWLKAQHSENEDYGIWSHHFMWNRWGNSGKSDRLYCFQLQNHCRWWLQPETLLSNKGPSSQDYGFSSGHVWMWELDCEDSWAPKNWCFWTVVLEKTLESPLYSKEIKPVNPKGNQPWIVIGRTIAEAEAPVPQPPDAKSWLFGKDPDAGKGWRQEEKGAKEDEMVGWIINSVDMSLSKTQGDWKTGKPGVLQSMGSHRVRYDWAAEQQQYLFEKERHV